jgi:hypothetical protein
MLNFLLKKTLFVFVLFILPAWLPGQVISRFNWNIDKTTAAVGPNATAISASSLLSSTVGFPGADGTSGLNPGPIPNINITMTIPNNSPGFPNHFDVDGMDISIYFQRDENQGFFLSRISGPVGGTGNGLPYFRFGMGGAGQLSVSFPVEDGLGGFTIVTSPNIFAIPADDTFRQYALRYDPNTGIATVKVDGTTVWTNNGTPGRKMYWQGLTNFPMTIGGQVDGTITGTAQNKPVFDNFATENIPLVPPGSEICNNGLDDDGDGFVDFFDTDCACADGNFFGRCTDDCVYDSGFANFSLTSLWSSVDNISTYTTPIVADIDKDGTPEAIMMSANSLVATPDPRRSKDIRIINGATGATERNITTPFMAWVGPVPIAVADVDNDGFGEIIIATIDNTDNPVADRAVLICYEHDGTFKWRSNATYGQTNAARNFGSSVGIADFNQDGIPEVYVYNEIFNAQTGVKLVDGGANGISLMVDAGFGALANPVAAELISSNSSLELAAGRTVYTVNITNPAGTAGNTMTAVNYSGLPATAANDGFTSVADIDNDGNLDVVVHTFSAARLYVWNPRTNALIAERTGLTLAAGGAGVGVPFIGDVDNDNQPEIGIIRTNTMQMFEYVAGNTTLQQKWLRTVTDPSGFTGITMFDFNQDGKTEIVYRDEDDIRILDGSGSSAVDLITAGTLPCASGTGADMAIVVDIDGNGSAEFCVTCGQGAKPAYTGNLRVFKSPTRPYAPARKIWNQYGYHVVNINDDLSIPRQQQNQAKAFSAGIPLNNYLVQATIYDKNGSRVYPAADASIKINSVGANLAGNLININFDIINTATAATDLANGLRVAFFRGDPNAGGSLLGTYTTTVPIAPGTQRNIVHSITGIGSPIIFNLYAVVNNAGASLPITLDNYQQAECNYNNNIDNVVIADRDADGIADGADIDDDNDGILDTVEGGGINPNADADGNNIVNMYDPGFAGFVDTNADGLNDNFDKDLDGVPNHFDLDADNDGINDLRESGLTASQILTLDANSDGVMDGPFGTNGLDNGAETVADNGTPIYGTPRNTDMVGPADYLDLDSDNDGINDIIESGYANIDTNLDGLVDGSDADGDGIRTAADGNDTVYGDANDQVPADTDKDNVFDFRDLDSDNDAINDVVEGGYDALDTNNDGKLDSGDTGATDTDNDGITDFVDGVTGISQIDANAVVFGDANDITLDSDKDGILDFRDLDTDNDGINDIIEYTTASLDADGNGQVDGADTDGDGIRDNVDNLPATFGDLTDPTANDSDTDNVPDYRDLDSDNDTINDVVEGGNAAQDANADGIVDGIDNDGDGIRNSVDGNINVFGDIGSGTAPNTDNPADAIPDFRDLDSDNDTVFDIHEPGPNGTNPLDTNNDGRVDNLTDPDGDGIVGGADGEPVTFGDGGDRDNDGVLNSVDLDDDNDGIPDLIEGGGIDDPSADADNDGLPNYADTGFAGFIDSNTDGVNDNFDRDLDGVPNHLDLDADNDGIADVVEAGGIDANGDGILDFSQASANAADADNNGLIDNIQVSASPNLSKLTAGTANGGFYPLNNQAIDTDSDGVSDFLDIDADNDGLMDVAESGGNDSNNDGRIDFSGTFAANDLDNDGWIDTKDASQGGIAPILTIGVIGSSPTNYSGNNTDGDTQPDFRDLDSDNDGINDVREAGLSDLDNNGIIESGAIPAVDANGKAATASSTSIDTDGDNVPDQRDLDSDNDGINDIREVGNESFDANNDGIVDGSDVDNDGIRDIVDGNDAAFGDNGDADSPDKDNDGVANYRDLDSDNDGINDIIEGGFSPLDTNNDGIIDGTDADNDGIRDSVDGNDAAFGDNGDNAPQNTDGDAVSDYLDLDSDNDGINDVTEDGNTNLDTNNDGILDGVDSDGDGIKDNVDGNDSGFGDANDANQDTDEDGIIDSRDLDSDNDGINDIREGFTTNIDLDGNGVVDGNDADIDGILDNVDGNDASFGDSGDAEPIDTDGDTVPDYQDLDSDNDSVNDVVENTDLNGNGIIDGGETNLDVNGDGIVDGSDADNDGIRDLIDGDDANFGDLGDNTPIDIDTPTPDGTPNYRDRDSDGDGSDDIDEVGNSTLDANNDGRIDNTSDIDGDGIVGLADGAPIKFGDGGDSDGDGVPDTDPDGAGALVGDLDDDNDGIPDIVEGKGVNPSADADSDNIPNYIDTVPGGAISTTDINNDGVLDVFDQDLDGIPNHLDLDSDNDGIADVIEAGGVDVDGNGIVDFSEASANIADNDNDGLIDNIDQNPAAINADAATASELTNGSYGGIYPVGGAINRDGDALADFLDIDADNDGIYDVIEAFGIDANDDGRIDFSGTFASNDSNNNGWINSKDGGSGGTSPITTTGTPGSIPSTYVGGNTDNDAVPDFRDLDSDNDGINDVREAGLADSNNDGILGGASPSVNANGAIASADSSPLDTDVDGVADFRDLDSDNDGINDVRESNGTDSDNNGIFDGTDGVDADGIVGTADANTSFGDTGDTVPIDTDNDSVADFRDLDTDNDGINDVRENNGIDANNDGTVDGNDVDGDGIRSTADNNNGFGDLNDATPINTDFDVNQIADYRDLDSDNDGINDVKENNGLDGNGDGLADGDDVDGDGIRSSADSNGGFGDLNDAAPINTDGDTVADFRDLDSDNDSINDVRESNGTDTDGDGLFDGTDADNDGILETADANVGFGDANDPSSIDTDNDGVADFRDLDSDNDSVNDVTENGGLDTNADGIQDGTDDDNDGILGFADGNDTFWRDVTDINSLDNDSDGIPNYRDLYSNDNTNSVLTQRDIFIAGNAALDGNNNGVIDNVTDPEGDGIVGGADGRPLVFGDGGDTDGDGVADNLDADDDNDGIADIEEGNGSNPSADDNNNGVPNYLDNTFLGFVDSNGDGINDNFDFDRDGVPNHLDLDSDNDGIADVREAGGADGDNDGRIGTGTVSVDANGTPTAGALTPTDNDGDNIDNFLDLDSDNDGIADVVEASANNADSDPDANGLLGNLTRNQLTLNLNNVNSNGLVLIASLPTLIIPVNTDGDTFGGNGIPDYLDLDSDNDGITDIIEVGGADGNNDGRIGVGSIVDLDNDGWSDLTDNDDPGASLGLPIHRGDGDDNIDGSFNGTDLIPNYRDLDSDNDGISDVIEASISNIQGTSPDADNDGRLNTTIDANGLPTGGPLTPPNTDGDAVANFLDLDSDSDGIPDLWEVGASNPGIISGFDPNFDGKVGGNGAIADTDNDGWANNTDPSNGGAIIFDGTSAGSTPRDDQDADNQPNHLDLNSDAEGLGDMWEGFDDDNDGGALDDLIARASTFNPINGSTATYPATDSDNDGTPDWGEDTDNDGIPNYLDPQSPFYFDTDNDGLIDLFDPDNNDPGTPVGKLVGCGSGPNGIPDQNSNGNPSYLDNTDVIALPVTFISFEGRLLTNKVKLEWKTLAETNNSHFIIERSLNTQTWTEIAQIKAKGESQSQTSYLAFDENPQIGTNYYRLWQVDKDGTREAYPRWVDIAYNFTPITTVYPNPSIEKIKLKLKSNPQELVMIKILNQSGNVVLETNYQKNLINDEPELNLKNLPSGTYIIKIIYFNALETLKFVKQ